MQANHGSWQVSDGRTSAADPAADINPPRWVWDGLNYFAPEAAKAAAEAINALSAAAYAKDGAKPGSSQMAESQSVARMSLVTAAFQALPKAQAAVAQPNMLRGAAGMAGKAQGTCIPVGNTLWLILGVQPPHNIYSL